jgi:hypothetical protein
MATKGILNTMSPKKRAECKQAFSLLFLKGVVLKYNVCLLEAHRTMVKILLFRKKRRIGNNQNFNYSESSCDN